MEKVLVGMILGLLLAIAIVKFKQMESDLIWCKVYVDNHLNKEQAGSLK
jgi:hypothetical protein